MMAHPHFFSSLPPPVLYDQSLRQADTMDRVSEHFASELKVKRSWNQSIWIHWMALKEFQAKVVNHFNLKEDGILPPESPNNEQLVSFSVSDSCSDSGEEV